MFHGKAQYEEFMFSKDNDLAYLSIMVGLGLVRTKFSLLSNASFWQELEDLNGMHS